MRVVVFCMLSSPLTVNYFIAAAPERVLAVTDAVVRGDFAAARKAHLANVRLRLIVRVLTLVVRMFY